MEKIYLTIPVQCCLSIPSENKTNNGTKQNNIKTPDEYDNQDVIVGSEIKGWKHPTGNGPLTTNFLLPWEVGILLTPFTKIGGSDFCHYKGEVGKIGVLF